MSTTQVRERPILFTPAMAQAIAEGRKTQTRRVCKGQPCTNYPACGHWRQCIGECPYGVPGDRLWVRESVSKTDDGFVYRGAMLAMYKGKLDADSERCRRELGYRWTPNIHMPRVACRSVLEITGVRVERVEWIRTEDAVAEGFDNCTHFLNTFYRINKRAPEGSNPWVWVVEFKKSNGEGVRG